MTGHSELGAKPENFQSVAAESLNLVESSESLNVYVRTALQQIELTAAEEALVK